MTDDSDVCEEDGDSTLLGYWEPDDPAGAVPIVAKDPVTERPAWLGALVGCGHTIA